MGRFPEVFWLFLLFIPILIIFLWRYRAGMRTVKALGGLWRYPLLRESFMVKWFFSSLGFFVFISGIIFSIAGIAGPVKMEPFQPSGYDVIYVIDISRSMLARDEQNSRLVKAKSIIHSISDGLATGEMNLDSSRYGLVVFRGLGSRLFPLSEDKGGLYGILEALSPDFMSSPGTNIAAGLQTALESFVSGSETSRHIILFTDGEELEGDTGAVLNRFREKRVDFTIVGLGSIDGAFIPLSDGGRVTDSEGRDVITRMNPRVLERLAEQGGGVYLDGDDSRLLEQLLNRFSSISPREDGGFIQVETDLYRLYLLIALAGLFIYMGARVLKWKGRL